MNNLIEIMQNIGNNYASAAINSITIMAVLLATVILSVYEFFVYRFVSHRSFYNKQFNISITIIPIFIATIILCLQSNIVITLGTIGALAIIRYRTAIKDPIDMLYILWAVHSGIVCGCQLYQVAVLTSLVATILLVVLERFSIGKLPFVLVIHSKTNSEASIEKAIKKVTRKYTIKSRNYTSTGIDYVIEVATETPGQLTDTLKKVKEVEKFSIIEYDADDII